ncbi:hypothetical protein AURDEDRAFT_165515 [Auricularia subglabra TFB-10046 SS5]|nr:hypothetical protein AURDEDRAFT_165515 [Auricularia subglabra TFB-10046 SS5]
MHRLSLPSSVARPRRPSAAHFFCMNDPNGDVTENLASLLAGNHATGRVEVKNRVDKTFTGPTVAVLQTFEQLNSRPSGLTMKETLCQSTLVHHETHLSRLFRRPLALNRQRAGQFARHRCYEQIKNSLFYAAEVIRLSQSMRQWAGYRSNAYQHQLSTPQTTSSLSDENVS